MAFTAVAMLNDQRGISQGARKVPRFSWDLLTNVDT